MKLLFLLLTVMISNLTQASGVSGSSIGQTSLTKVEFNQLSGWNHSKARLAMKALHNSCSLNKKQAPVAYGLSMTLPAWNELCHNILRQSENNSKSTIEQYFEPYKIQIIGDNNANGLLTGYYTPLLNGSLQRDDAHQVPIYAIPNNKNDQTAFTRAQINDGALVGKAEVVMWLDSQIEAFFLHIQGHGYVKLPDGSTKKLVFSGKNSAAYTAIGKYFVTQGLVSAQDISMQWLKNWLNDNPEKATEIMNLNQSYIFFAVENASSNIRGAESTPLTPMVSLAIDPNYVSYGIPLFVSSKLPNGAPFSTLGVAQDTGSAIKGALRADLYTGIGKKAESLAGELKSLAHFYVLYPRKTSLEGSF